jgi:hypothetical protein
VPEEVLAEKRIAQLLPEAGVFHTLRLGKVAICGRESISGIQITLHFVGDPEETYAGIVRSLNATAKLGSPLAQN